MLNDYQQVRQQTLALTEWLSAEDMILQSMPDASPTKWHLAHTTWFFETFLLQPHLPGYRVFHPSYTYLFNSYYDTVGDRHPRPTRGLLSRPPLSEVLAYREYVDSAMVKLFEQAGDKHNDDVTIGLHHEMQHQELILTDIKHALSFNDYAFPEPAPAEQLPASQPDREFTAFKGGLTTIGTNAESGFAYDCEQPEHKVYVPDFSLRNSLITNQEWLEFMADGGYERPKLWLSDGWARCQREHWQAPLYWRQTEDHWQALTLHGYQQVDPLQPVCHISYYEADAFARWAGYRLPTEMEWEVAARNQTIDGNFSGSGRWHPQAPAEKGLTQLYGDVWEWTQSPFLPYHGFQPPGGALAEYNGKFMANQWVLRGGSCATAKAQLRPTYRNFFYAHQRWQFSGLRLAR
ncbi:hypothetical protein IDSA_06050 [Pseudidiomarina salinarum]|uniref:Sulfatase maturase n=1 Tax=Pseudidiomarina salinarum TaxID=435908 RepID=A0A094IV94_9GAMM|nr:ergothioneine biosynthesis protein EgtB [Pseudidiomarina salinarum]KFZ31042.1 hypothetical protein IDSA_06050 [Pseudidiomarina salinarum]RUO71125.1 ergothioneine biosynthesis protein EgtB [Pseudidiomarina salinarum]